MRACVCVRACVSSTFVLNFQHTGFRKQVVIPDTWCNWNSRFGPRTRQTAPAHSIRKSPRGPVSLMSALSAYRSEGQAAEARASVAERPPNQVDKYAIDIVERPANNRIGRQVNCVRKLVNCYANERVERRRLAYERDPLFPVWPNSKVTAATPAPRALVLTTTNAHEHRSGTRTGHVSVAKPVIS